MLNLDGELVFGLNYYFLRGQFNWIMTEFRDTMRIVLQNVSLNYMAIADSAYNLINNLSSIKNN